MLTRQQIIIVAIIVVGLLVGSVVLTANLFGGSGVDSSDSRTTVREDGGVVRNNNDMIAETEQAKDVVIPDIDPLRQSLKGYQPYVEDLQLMDSKAYGDGWYLASFRYNSPKRPAHLIRYVFYVSGSNITPYPVFAMSDEDRDDLPGDLYRELPWSPY